MDFVIIIINTISAPLVHVGSLHPIPRPETAVTVSTSISTSISSTPTLMTVAESKSTFSRLLEPSEDDFWNDSTFHDAYGILFDDSDANGEVVSNAVNSSVARLAGSETELLQDIASQMDKIRRTPLRLRNNIANLSSMLQRGNEERFSALFTTPTR